MNGSVEWGAGPSIKAVAMEGLMFSAMRDGLFGGPLDQVRVDHYWRESAQDYVPGRPWPAERWRESPASPGCMKDRPLCHIGGGASLMTRTRQAQCDRAPESRVLIHWGSDVSLATG